MMDLTTDARSQRVYEALSSEVRLRMIDKLYERERSVKELAAELYLSSAIVSSHIRKLEEAGLVGSRMKRENGGTYKMCFMTAEYLQIKLSPAYSGMAASNEIAIPVGQFTDVEVWPTCGIATREKVIGEFDDPACFMDPQRVNAGILWFARGWVEYKIPNYSGSDRTLAEIEIAMEIGSEAPRFNANWPSAIEFRFNGVRLGEWTSPGDFGGQKGRLTPEWWHPDVNQYGLLKALRIRERGTFIDGQQLSGVGLRDLPMDSKIWTLRIAAEERTPGRGGLTLYGRGFGNYDQDIVVRTRYA